MLRRAAITCWTVSEGLACQKPAAIPASTGQENEVPLDPWKHPYLYSVPGEGGQPFALYSLGSDGQRGGTGDAADIGIMPPS